jgi:threonyl-tRNA synthetase
MKKFWRGFRREDDLAERQEKAKIRSAQLKKLRHLLEVGGHEAESEYVQAVKDWKPDITKEELATMIKRFHDAVSERQLRDRESR